MLGAVHPFVHVEYHDEIAVMLVQNPPVNALSPGVPEAIVSGLEQLNADDTVRAIVLAGAGRTFMAGADIREFQRKNPEPYLQHLCDCALAVEDSPKPVVIAIHGTAFGAGLETALAGHYRVMAAAAQLGQPEIKLGLIPGAGGTQRLPRLAGVEKALEMCAFGEPITARDAQAHGIVDLVLDGDLLAGTIGFAREVAGRPSATPLLKTRHRRVRAEGVMANSGWESWLAKARSRLPGQTAPLAAIRAVAAATELTFSDGMARERELFLECWQSTQAKALVYLFFAQRAAAKVPEAPAAPRAEEEPRVVLAPLGHAGAVEMNPESVVCVDHAATNPGTNFMEIVRGPSAGADRVKNAMDWARRRGKSAVVVGGFVGQRLARRYQQELAALGISAEQAHCAFVAQEKAQDSDDQTVERLMSALAQEGERIAHEGLVARESDIDVIWTLGYGFPAWRGGPMFMRKSEFMRKS
jgi:3-hydroxyacyl-CoA dehydrogenase